MTASERLGRWWAARQQTTDDVERRYNVRTTRPMPDRVPLTTNQHILHLILTIVTGGLWGVVWAIRAGQGNRR